MPIHSGFYYTEYNHEINYHPTVILLHGAGSDHLCWPAEFRRMPGQRVIALDLPAHGKSAGAAQQTIRGYTDKIIDFLGLIGISRAYFIGHSMGGTIALNLALNYPQHTAAAILIASGAHLNVPTEILSGLRSPVTAQKALNQLQQALFANLKDPELVRKSMQTLKNSRLSLLYSDWTACSDFDLRTQVEKISPPLWCANGTRDPFAPPACGYFLSHKVKNGENKVIRGGGHMLMLEYPQLLSQEINAFINHLNTTLYAI